MRKLLAQDDELGGGYKVPLRMTNIFLARLKSDGQKKMPHPWTDAASFFSAESFCSC
jgi:hypothetical protein